MAVRGDFDGVATGGAERRARASAAGGRRCL